MDTETKLKNVRLETELNTLYMMARKWQDDSKFAKVIYERLTPLIEELEREYNERKNRLL